jgi:hypothetical protein
MQLHFKQKEGKVKRTKLLGCFVPEGEMWKSGSLAKAASTLWLHKVIKEPGKP